MNIGIDLGYGYTKGVNGNLNKIMFPSLVSIGFERPLSGIFNSRNNVTDNMYVVVADNNGQGSYYVGDLAKREGFSDSFMLDTDKYSQKEAKVLLVSAAALLMADDSEPVSLSTGLPLEQYQSYKKAFAEELKDYKAIVSFPEYDISKVIKFDKVVIFPQAAGAVYYALMDNINKYMIEGSYLVLIDVGFKTTDYVVFAINGRLHFLPDLSGTLDIGMSKIFNALSKLYTQKTGSNTDTEGLMQILSTGSVYYKGKYVDFKNELNVLKRELAGLIQKSIAGSLKDRYDKISTILVSGGGGKDLYQYLKDFHPNVELVKDPQFANAYGFLKVIEGQASL